MYARGVTSALVCLTLAVFGTTVAAQDPEPETVLFEPPSPVRDIDTIPLHTSAFTFVRVRYSNGAGRRTASNSAWLTDYPDADQSFSREFERQTGIATTPNGAQLALTDPSLSTYPFIYVVEAGQMGLSDVEATALREYLLDGGFLMVDDFWGQTEWDSFMTEFRRAFPDREPFELPADHDLFSMYYQLDSERLEAPGRGGQRAMAPKLWGVEDDQGRLMALICHNFDLGDAWEHLSDPWYPREYSMGYAIPLGINTVLYALSR